MSRKDGFILLSKAGMIRVDYSGVRAYRFQTAPIHTQTRGLHAWVIVDSISIMCFVFQETLQYPMI